MHDPSYHTIRKMQSTQSSFKKISSYIVESFIELELRTHSRMPFIKMEAAHQVMRRDIVYYRMFAIRWPKIKSRMALIKMPFFIFYSNIFP